MKAKEVRFPEDKSKTC